MIQGQPVPTELDAAAERAAARRASVDVGSEPAPEAPAVAPPAAGPDLTAAAPPITDPAMVGVVFIHGIGAQRAGETLLAWTEPIVRALTAWRDDRGMPTDPVVTSKVDLTGRTTPFIELDVPADPAAPLDRPRQRWVLTEAWWASDVEAPGISDMLKWLIWRGEARRIGEGIITGINAADDAAQEAGVGPSGTRRSATSPVVPGPARRARDIGERFLLLCLFLVLAVVAVPLYGLIKLLSALPIPNVASAISTAQLDWFLSDWFGDVRVLLSDRAQAANIRSRVVTAIDALREHGCSRIVVVGHSGGTIVGYM